jgi:hypothetical protein
MASLRGLLAACLLATLALAGPQVDVVRDVRGVRSQRHALRALREPGAPMVRRNGLVARTDTRAFSLDQSLENHPIFNR